MGALLNQILALIFIGAMIWGFKIAGRKAKSVPVQMLLGFVFGFLILAGVVCVLCGILFVGCLVTGPPSFR